MRARRSAIRREQRRRRLRLAAVVAVLVVAVAAGAWLRRSPLLEISAIRVEGVDGPPAEQVLTTLDVPIGASIVDADLAAARRRVAALPFVADAAVDVESGEVVVDVTPRPAAAVLVTPTAAWVLDPAGVVIDGGERPGVPVVAARDVTVPPLGQPMTDTSVRASLAVLDALPSSLRARLRSTTVADGHVALLLDATGLLPAQEEVVVRLAGRPVGGGSAAADDASGQVSAGAQVVAGQAIGDQIAVARAMLQVVADRQRQEGDDARAVEIDVRAPANPVLRAAAERG